MERDPDGAGRERLVVAPFIVVLFLHLWWRAGIVCFAIVVHLKIALQR